MQQIINTKRVVWLDILRVLSALAIVFIHTSTAVIENLEYGSFNWFSADAYLAFARYAVPVFVMISGVFFLSPDKDINIKNIYTKYIFRMLTALLGWALIRTLVISVGLGAQPADKWACAFYTSIKMFWFLPMIIGLYAVTPFLRPLTALKNKALLEYFIILSFFLALCLPVAAGIIQAYFPKTVLLADFTTLIKIPMFIFGAHFVFGYYAYNYDLSRKLKTSIYAAAVISGLLMAAGTYAFWGDKASKIFFYSMHGASLSPLAFLLGAGVFVFCKDFLGTIKFGDKAVRLIEQLAYYSLGVYLLHIIIVEVLAHYGLFKYLDFCGLIIIPLAACAIFLAANLIIALLYKIKLFRKYCL